MSGHSKWHQIRHKKAKEDVKRGAIFSKLSRAITVAAKEGGGNPETNAALETAIQKARDFNMPAENIERAIKRGTGELTGVHYEGLVYEGYGPSGVAIMVDVMTDNRNRAASDMRHIFTKHNGNLGTSGCVSWMFEKKGHIIVDKSEKVDEDELLAVAIEAGADDINITETQYEIVMDPACLAAVRKVLERHGIEFVSAEITMLPKNVVCIKSREGAKKILHLMDAIEEHEDVQEVYANFDIPDEVMEEVEAASPAAGTS